MQKELVQRVNAGESYDDLSEKIRGLKQMKDRALSKQAVQNEQMKLTQEIEEYLSQHEDSDLVFKDSLVRKLVDKIEVFRDKLIITFKTGTEVEIRI